MSTNVSVIERFGPLSVWLSPRRKRFWLVIAAVAYTLFGFFLAPWLARSQIVELTEHLLQRPVTLSELRINPYLLTAEVTGFRIDEQDGAPLIGFDRLYVNFQLASVFRRALVFREVRLERPHASIVRDETSAINLVELFSGIGGDPEPADATADDASGLPGVVIEAMAISAGVVDLHDRALVTAFSTQLGPIDINVSNLSTLPNEAGQQQVSITSEAGTQFAWQGSLQIEPLLSQGTVTMNGPYLPLIYRYFQDDLNFTVHAGEVTMAFTYYIELLPAGVLTASIEDLSGELLSLTASANDREIEFLNLPHTRFTGGYFRWPEHRAGAESLEFHEAKLELWRDADGALTFSQLLVPSPGAAPDEEAAVEQPAEREPAEPWDLRLAAFRIADLRMGLTDDALIEPGRLEFSDIDVAIDDLSNKSGAEFPTTLTVLLGDSGRLDVDGTLAVIPEPEARVNVSVSKLALASAQPWIADALQVTVNDGHLDAELEASFGPDARLNVAGALSLGALDVQDVLLDERLVGWDELEIDRLRFAGAENALEISGIMIRAPYARVLIAEDGSTNFSSLGRDKGPTNDATWASEAAGGSDSATAAGIGVTIGRIQVDDGTVNFTDLALPFPFAAKVQELAGGVSTLATASSQPATIDLEGKVDEFGFARIEGSLLPADLNAATKLHVLFRNVEFPNLSPYTVKFAGRRIDDGRLEVDLYYVIEGGQLNAENSLVIDRIELGEKVDYPDALNLPLGLAIALLQDPSGRINIDLPVTGDVNDPEFSVGGVVLRAFANLITKAVTAPFRLLGSLVGAKSETFDEIEFEPGETDLTPPEREKLLQLADALNMRPKLGLTVPGAIEPEIDAQAMKTARVNATIARLLAEDQSASGSEMIATRRRKATERLFHEAYPDLNTADIRSEFTTPVDPESPDGVSTFDELAYVAELRDRLIAAEAIGPEDLATLAAGRADAVVQQLTDAGNPVAADRIERGDTHASKPNKRGFIPLKLELRQ